MSTGKVDAAIVGSGASGSLLAAKLAQTGKKVLVLEAGPERTASDLYSSQLWARRLKWSGPRVEEFYPRVAIPFLVRQHAGNVGVVGYFCAGGARLG